MQSQKPFRAFNDIYNKLAAEGFSEEVIGCAIASCVAASKAEGKGRAITIGFVKNRLNSKSPVTTLPKEKPKPISQPPADFVWSIPLAKDGPLLNLRERINRIAQKAKQHRREWSAQIKESEGNADMSEGEQVSLNLAKRALSVLKP